MLSYVVHVRIGKVGLLGHIGNIGFGLVLGVVGQVGVGCVIVCVAAQPTRGARRLEHDLYPRRASRTRGRGERRYRATFIVIIGII